MPDPVHEMRAVRKEAWSTHAVRTVIILASCVVVLSLVTCVLISPLLTPVRTPYDAVVEGADDAFVARPVPQKSPPEESQPYPAPGPHIPVYKE